MLTQSQRERILSHLQRGWKLPDSLVQELWRAYEDLESSQPQHDATAHSEHEVQSSRSERRSMGGNSSSPAC